MLFLLADVCFPSFGNMLHKPMVEITTIHNARTKGLSDGSNVKISLEDVYYLYVPWPVFLGVSSFLQPLMYRTSNCQFWDNTVNCKALTIGSRPPPFPVGIHFGGCQHKQVTNSATAIGV